MILEKAFALGLHVAAARRVTRLVTKDEIAAPVREWVWRHEHPKLTYLVNCPYCVSVWAGFIVPVLPARVVWALAVSELVTAFRGEEV